MKSLRTRSWGFFVLGIEDFDDALPLSNIHVWRLAMVVVMKSGASQAQIDHVVKLVREMGCKDHVIQGTERTVVAVIGDDRNKDRSRFETVDGVEKVVPILAPYKMASREVKKERTIVPLGGNMGAK